MSVLLPQQKKEILQDQMPKSFLSKEQAYKGGIILGILIITVICTYILWALLSNDDFLPYTGEAFVPQTINIFAFLVLFTLIASGVLTLIATLILVIHRYVKKRVLEFNDRLVLTLYIMLTLFLFITLLLHVFKIVNFIVSLLCFIAFWGIVAYVQARRKSRFQKYIPKSDRSSKGGNPVKIPGK